MGEIMTSDQRTSPVSETDIVLRLRHLAKLLGVGHFDIPARFNEAADEIERLRGHVPSSQEQDFVDMLWKWFEDRGCDLRTERRYGLTADDFRVMLDEHEAALSASSRADRAPTSAEPSKDAVSFINTRLEDLAEASAIYGKDQRLNAPDKIARNEREISWLKELRSIISLSLSSTLRPAKTCADCGKIDPCDEFCPNSSDTSTGRPKCLCCEEVEVTNDGDECERCRITYSVTSTGHGGEQ